ncbi:hypothetical protein PV08_08987 [Exophiala spinifera]|uniref:Ubiquitin-like domain-containing protein n=1 Tax=Exophiala spinifera TaxID=91928 RepID=A0A0D2B520_9EURO|nr:uncharacterized protein PV08_08987 [Exophiala spinifera]KIW13795.1 hypothetical protein PV08_08987 [Exophiala spinifera]
MSVVAPTIYPTFHEYHIIHRSTRPPYIHFLGLHLKALIIASLAFQYHAGILRTTTRPPKARSRASSKIPSQHGDLQFAKQFLTSIDNKPTKYQADHVFDPRTYHMRIPYTLPKLSNAPHAFPPKTKPAPPTAPGSESAKTTVSVTLKSTRNPNMTLTIPSMEPSTTTIQSLKEQVQAHWGGCCGPSVVQVDKIKLLQNKKPIPPSKKVLTDAVDEKELRGHLELGVMVMGGAPDPKPQVMASLAAAAAAAAATATAKTSVSKKGDGTPMEGVESTATAQVQQAQADSSAASEGPVQPGEPSGESVLHTSGFWDDLQGFLEQRIRNQSDAARLRDVFESAWRSHSSGP